eukprot:Hpha_TRINITY_DN3483_c0_g1::TRINITY_DN3483_c0_g1_i1::g.32512::m.32512
MADLSFGVPDAAVEAPEGAPVDGGNLVSKKVETREEAAKKKQKALDYLESKQVLFFLDSMLHDLFLKMPDDPVDFCLSYLLRHDSMAEIQRQAPERRKSTAGFSDEARAWSAKWKVPFLLDDLLADIIKEEPAEPDRFAAAWFRWNKKNFMVKHHCGMGKEPRKLPQGWAPAKV